MSEKLSLFFLKKNIDQAIPNYTGEKPLPPESLEDWLKAQFPTFLKFSSKFNLPSKQDETKNLELYFQKLEEISSQTINTTENLFEQLRQFKREYDKSLFQILIDFVETKNNLFFLKKIDKESATRFLKLCKLLNEETRREIVQNLKQVAMYQEFQTLIQDFGKEIIQKINQLIASLKEITPDTKPNSGYVTTNLLDSRVSKLQRQDLYDKIAGYEGLIQTLEKYKYGIIFGLNLQTESFDLNSVPEHLTTFKNGKKTFDFYKIPEKLTYYFSKNYLVEGCGGPFNYIFDIFLKNNPFDNYGQYFGNAESLKTNDSKTVTLQLQLLFGNYLRISYPKLDKLFPYINLLTGMEQNYEYLKNRKEFNLPDLIDILINYLNLNLIPDFLENETNLDQVENKLFEIITSPDFDRWSLISNIKEHGNSNFFTNFVENQKYKLRDHISKLFRIGVYKNMQNFLLYFKEVLDEEIITENKGFIEKSLMELIKNGEGNQAKEIFDILKKNYPNFDLENLFNKYLVYHELYSNQIPEIITIRDQVVDILIESENSKETLKKIICIFELDKIPLFAKKFLVFKYLFQIEHKTQFTTELSVVVDDLRFHSPVLDNLWKKKDFNRLYNLVFRDIMKNAILSGEKSTLDFFKTLGYCEKEILETGELISYNVENVEKNTKLNLILNQIYALHSQGIIGQKNKLVLNEDFKNLNISEKVECLRKILSGEVFTRLEEIYLSPLGIESFTGVLEVYKETLKNANLRNKQNSENPEELFSGDTLTKGVNSQYFPQILDSGNNCSELLGASNGWTRLDYVTPLDIDLNRQDLTLGEEKTKLFNYKYMGSDLIFGFKNRGQFEFTEDPNIGLQQSGYYYNDNYKDIIEVKKANFKGNETKIFAKDYTIWQGKYEAFNVAADFLEHYCIRTGIASTEIDFMVFDPNDKSGFESLKYYLARKALYIPIYDRNRNLIFSYKDWERYKQIFAGTKYSDLNLQVVIQDENLPRNIQLELSKIKDQTQNQKIQNNLATVKSHIEMKIIEVLSKNQVKLRTNNEIDIYGAEIVDTGSTGRGTNKANGIDFDLAILIDNNTFYYRKDKILADLQNIFTAESIVLYGNTLRFFGVDFNGQKIDADISFVPKQISDKIISSGQAIKQKFENIENNQGFSTLEQVKQQIILAKTLLSRFNCYKTTYSGESEASGMGGIGVETWILSNQGSFYEACKTFLEISQQSKDLEEFQQKYKIYTYTPGSNLRFLGKEFTKVHDCWVFCLNQSGYQNMIEMCQTILS